MKKTAKNDELDLLHQVYSELRRDAASFAEHLLNSRRRFKYFCSSLIAYSAIFLVLGLCFVVPENFMAATPLLALCATNLLYALLLWKDYSKMCERYGKLTEIEEELKRRRE